MVLPCPVISSAQRTLTARDQPLIRIFIAQEADDITPGRATLLPNAFCVRDIDSNIVTE
jgi:hypothetical protein